MNQSAAKRQGSTLDTIRIAAFNGNGSAGEWELKKDMLTIGRVSTNDVCLNDKKVSRTHCTIEMRPEGLFLKDGGSSNGTWVNGQKAHEILLKHGFGLYYVPPHDHGFGQRVGHTAYSRLVSQFSVDGQALL